MKSVVFVINTMNVGGVEKALLGVLKKFLAEGWEVHVAMLKVAGGFMPYIPKEVSIHQIQGFEDVKPLLHTPLRPTIAKRLLHCRLIEAAKLSVCYLQQKFLHSATWLYKHGFKQVPMFSDRTFDLAVAFAGPDSFIDTYVAERINAREKWGWIHFDITKFGINPGIIRKAYKKYPKINIVSKQAKENFDRLFPEFAAKTAHTPNIVDRDSILEMAEEPVELPPSEGEKIILTVGRVSAEKGQYMVLQVIKEMVDKGRTDFHWWFVGDGSGMKRCRDFVVANHLCEYVQFFGAKANPYPYMKACDLYVQPSQHEGFCITLAEAKLFGMPIITTDFTGAAEQLATYPDSWIVRYDVREMENAVAKAIDQ